MAKTEIEYVVDVDGTFTMETIGVKGHTCTDVLKKVVQQVNGTVIDEKKKAEYYDKSPKATIRGGAN